MNSKEIAIMLSHLSPEHLEIIKQMIEEKMNAHNRVTTDTPSVDAMVS